MRNRCDVVSMKVDVVNLDSALRQIETLAAAEEGAYVCVSNVHMCMEVLNSEYFSDVVNSADIVIPDGRPISWAQKLLGYKGAEQVRGQDIMNAICSASTHKGFSIGLYGGSSDELLSSVVDELSNTHPGINIVFFNSPPFRPLTDQEDRQIIDEINSSNVDVLFVGIGCPKQEIWMAEHRNHLSCVMLGVGAAFDFIAGSKKHAPRWMQRAGLEWLFRLGCEPNRLWKRYLTTNPKFVYYFSKQWLRQQAAKYTAR